MKPPGGLSRAVIAFVTVLLVHYGPAAELAQASTVDALLSRVSNDPNPHPYTMTADFKAVFAITLPTGRFNVHAQGTILETRVSPGAPRQRKATITRLDVPLMLRPFSSAIRKTVTDLIEVEQKPAEILPFQDVFIAEEQPPSRYLLGGVRTDIVKATMRRYGQEANLEDITTRRAIARWLWSPSQRASIVRPGPGPYMLTALVDDTGLIHQLILYYDWGQIGSRITFVTIGGRRFWREVISDTSSEVAGIGRVDGQMILHVSNHCLNCPPP
jgi:hypothetical protein